MTERKRDFRYEMPDGKIVEAFQVTDASLFQDELSPDWFDSKMLMTKSAADTTKTVHWLMIGDSETEIPAYGWIVKDQNDTITCVDYSVMEEARKLVKEILEIPPAAVPMTDAALMLAAKLSKKSVDECRDEDLMNVAQANANRQKMIDSLDPAEALERGFVQTQAEPVMGDQFPDDYEPDEPPRQTTEAAPAMAEAIRNTEPSLTASADLAPGYGPFLEEMREVYRLLVGPGYGSEEGYDQGMEKLAEALIARTAWCSCAPGSCDGERDQWECRKNSLLVGGIERRGET